MAATAQLTDGPHIIWRAQSGPQSHLIRCPTFDVFFGGARGGGKTDGVLGEWARHASRYGADAIGIMFRRTLPQLVETIERSRAMFTPIGAVYHEQAKMWRFPNGARLRFAYLERDADADAYQGHSYTRVYVEEIGTFPSERPILKLMATLRSGAGVPVGFRATGNPGGPGHQWVKARYIDPAPGGWKIIVDPATNLERIYIPSRVTDNVYLGRDYIQRLRASGSETLVKAWLQGDWDAIEGAFFDCWSQRNVIPPFTVPKDWVRFRSGDWGSASPFSFGWWAVVQDDFTIGTDVSGRHQRSLAENLAGGASQRSVVIPRGALVRYREWYGSDNPAASSKGLKITAEEMGEGIAKREQGEKLAYGVLDPRCFAVESGPSIAERINGKLLAAKCAPFRKAENKRVNATQSKDGSGPINGWDQMRARIIGQLDDKGNSTGVPMVYCFNTCLASIRTIPVLQHDPDKAEDLDTESEDHAADDWRYACSSRPWTRTIPKPDAPPDPYKPMNDPLAEDVQSSVKLI